MGPNRRIHDLRKLFPSGGVLAVDELTNPVALDTAGLQIATASQVADQQVLAAALLAPGLAALAANPRNVTFTVAGGTAAHAPTSADIVGYDVDNKPLLETVAITASAGTYAGAKCFSRITSITKKGGTGTGATVAMGFGKVFGLRQKVRDRAGRRAVIQEVSAGSVVTNGTFVSAASSPPNGSYSPNTNPDGSVDYSVTYERSLT